MQTDSLFQVFIAAAIVNNFVLTYFLGICPFLGVSGKLKTSLRMGLAVMFVMFIASLSAWGLYRLLVIFHLEYLKLIVFIAVIASTVQFVEMFVRRYLPPLYDALGIYLPLITTNCAILGVALFQTNRNYSLGQSLFWSLGAGTGFTLALLLMAGIRERLELARIPSVIKGTGLTLLVAGMLSLAFTGFTGLGSQ